MEYSPEEFLAHVNTNRAGTVLDVLDIKLLQADKQRIVATMPVGPNHRQNFGYLHGGVSVVLAETIASLGSALQVDDEKQSVFGLEINANHIRPKRDGMVTGVATPIHLGRTTHVWEVRISDEQDRLICISRCTVAVVDRPSNNSHTPIPK